MLSYIADINTAMLLQNICKRKNILILNGQNTETDIKQYIKETKVNFNLIKYLFIDLRLVQNNENEIVESVYDFSKLYAKTRIIIFAPNYDEQNSIFTNLYELGFYDIINESESNEIESKLNKILDVGLNKKEAKQFKKQEEIKQKESKIKDLITKVKSNIKSKRVKKSKIIKTNTNKNYDIPNYSVYLFSLLLEAVTRLVKFICYVLVFVLTSIGLTILFNEELRNIVFQIFGLK